MSNTGTFIYIENQRHDLPTEETSAEEIRRLGNIPPDNKIFREIAGDEPDPELPPSGLFKVHHGEKFYAVPPGVFGAVQIDEECADLIARYGGQIQLTSDGQRYLLLQKFPLGAAWNPPVTPLAIRITGYPEAQLDGFYVPGTMRLASGAQRVLISSPGMAPWETHVAELSWIRPAALRGGSLNGSDLGCRVT